MADKALHAMIVERTVVSLEKIRQTRPRVHCLTNPVAQNFSANILLAAGAVPSMTADVDVIEDFIDSTHALVVNLGMLDDVRKSSIPVAVARATKTGKPWLLDPVKVDRSAGRLNAARELIAAHPLVVRCNEQEKTALFCQSTGFSGVVAMTGPCDRIEQGNRQIDLANGNPIMDRVTAMGCALSALTCAFLAVDDDPWMATVSGLLVMGVAGDMAAASSRGPGSFQVELLDQLFALNEQQIVERAKIK